MNRIFQVMFPLATLFIVASANAGGWASQNAIIEFINIESNIVRIKFKADDEADPDECGETGYIILSDDTTNGDRQYSALLAAQMAQKPTKLYVNGCFEKWNTSYPKLHAVFLLNES